MSSKDRPIKTTSDTQISQKLSTTTLGGGGGGGGASSSIYWFRKGLRLHDNPALNYALENSIRLYPVFILDPYFVAHARVGPNRWRFLVESLQDLDQSLRAKYNSRLLVVRGSPLQVLREKFAEWKIDLLCFESDTEPYAKKRDSDVASLAREFNVRVETRSSHTLYDPALLYSKNGNKVGYTYQSFLGLMTKMGEPSEPIEEPKTVKISPLEIDSSLYTVPTLDDLQSVDQSKLGPRLYPGGESEALKRLAAKLANENWVATFEKPDTSPNSIEPSTTVLSPYLKFGCLSPKLFYKRLREIYRKRSNYSKPPVSLHGQLIWREFFYFCGAYTPNFDRIEGNPICRKIKWDNNEEYLSAWREGRTGFPFIDAIMNQLRTEGWIHHLARHAVACFLTRGDLYVSWVKGMDVFEEYLLDADWSLNAANWQWLSCSAFFSAYFRVYSPIAFGKKTDKNGDYIRKYVPVLKNMPAKYIFEPWMAPPAVQKLARCVVGVDYPKPIVDHALISKKNIERMKGDFADSARAQAGLNAANENENEDVDETPKSETIKQDTAKPPAKRPRNK